MPEVPGSILDGDGQFSFFSVSVERNSVVEKKFPSATKMPLTMYKRETCGAYPGKRDKFNTKLSPTRACTADKFINLE